MDIEITNYKKEYDQELLKLFYHSIFYDKMEFEYIRIPESWIYRYAQFENSIQKIVLKNNKVIASLGIIVRDIIIKEEIVKIGYFVDNCILPEYIDCYEDIFTKLFLCVEDEAKKKDIVIIQGWEYLKNFEEHKTFFRRLGFKYVSNVNWISSSINFEEYDKAWERTSFIWKIGFTGMEYHHRIRKALISDIPSGINIRLIKKEDISKICDFLNMRRNIEFSSFISQKDFIQLIKKEIIFGIIAEKDADIVGVLITTTVAWGGMMFRRPCLDNDYTPLISFAPDEFIITTEYSETSVPSHMILELMRINIKNGKPHKKKHAFITDVFDTRIKWRKDALIKLGFTEPKFDYGIILAKSLRDDIELDTNKPWHIPSRCIVAPVPINSSYKFI